MRERKNTQQTIENRRGSWSRAVRLTVQLTNQLETETKNKDISPNNTQSFNQFSVPIILCTQIVFFLFIFFWRMTIKIEISEEKKTFISSNVRTQNNENAWLRQMSALHINGKMMRQSYKRTGSLYNINGNKEQKKATHTNTHRMIRKGTHIVLTESKFHST